MQIALDGADTYLAAGMDTALCQQGLKKAGAHVHGAGSDQHLWDKDLVVFEFLTDHVHS